MTDPRALPDCETPPGAETPLDGKASTDGQASTDGEVVADVAELPDLDDTADLRRGPHLHDDLLAVLPLLGVWRGRGAGLTPATGHRFRYAQQLSFSHDGRPFLRYESRTWLLADDGAVLRPASRELGFWRVGRTDDELEVVLALATGLVEVLLGTAGDLRWELTTATVDLTPTAKSVGGEKRLYALVGDRLVYVQELAIEAGSFQPHLSGELERVRA